jgi:5-(carboxyamino)imidazole ribonucleotide synthase
MNQRERNLGMMGGGQLARMWAQEAVRMGFQVTVLEPDASAPAAALAHTHLACAYTDAPGLSRLGASCCAVSTEFENVPADSLRQLAEHTRVSPAGDAVAVAQDRVREKKFIQQAGVPVAPYLVLSSAQDLEALPQRQDLYPAILKTARMGYDGKGQVRVQDAAQARQAWLDMQTSPAHPVVCVLEKMLPLAQEVSVILARDDRGRVVTYPVVQNVHHQGILALTIAPAPALTEALSQQARAYACAIAQQLQYLGVLAVEFFVLADGQLVANEMAPRPHNSGHWTIEACDINQFELQVRTMADLPLVEPRQHSFAVMLNLLGDIWPLQGQPDWSRILALPGVSLHLYGKAQARAGRKMGHITVTASSPEQARACAQQCATHLGLVGF